MNFLEPLIHPHLIGQSYFLSYVAWETVLKEHHLTRPDLPEIGNNVRVHIGLTTDRQ
jgi:hypothetical protein